MSVEKSLTQIWLIENSTKRECRVRKMKLNLSWNLHMVNWFLLVALLKSEMLTNTCCYIVDSKVFVHSFRFVSILNIFNVEQSRTAIYLWMQLNSNTLLNNERERKMNFIKKFIEPDFYSIRKIGIIVRVIFTTCLCVGRWAWFFSKMCKVRVDIAAI